MSAFTKRKKQMILCCLVAVTLAGICHGSPDWTAYNCFTCRDKDRCPNIVRIFGPDDSLLFEKNPTDNIPKCSGVFSVAKNCSVCHANSNIIIYCPNHTQTLEAEMDGLPITNISKGCDEEQNTYCTLHGPTTSASQISAHTGLIFVGLLFTKLG